MKLKEIKPNNAGRYETIRVKNIDTSKLPIFLSFRDRTYHIITGIKDDEFIYTSDVGRNYDNIIGSSKGNRTYGFHEECKFYIRYNSNKMLKVMHG